MKFRIGGVPEHFNLPIHLAIENDSFKQFGIEVEWITYEGGTGQMKEALRNDDADICVILTEGIVSDIIQGNPSKIISGYVKSPLIWGIYTGNESSLNNHEEIYNKQYAISRFGSGSHLMPFVDALMNDKQLKNEQFSVINNLQGALESLDKGETDVFYWEKYTTKPYVEKGLIRKIGEYATPWPCFVLAARQQIINEAPNQLATVLRVIQKSCAQFMENNNAIELVASRYQQELKDTEKWYHSTEWATDGWVSNKMLKNVVFTLHKAGIIKEKVNTEDLIWNRNSI